MMKRFETWRESYFTRALLGALVLLFLATTGSAQNTRGDLRYIADQYKQIAEDYLPGTPYQQAMNDLVIRLEAMSEDESSIAAQHFKPLIPNMLVNLKLFKDALSSIDKPQSPAYLTTTQATEQFPDAEYPNLQLSTYPALALPVFFDATSVLPTLVSFLQTGTVVRNQWTSSWVNAAPMSCITRLDDNGKPIRTPDFTMQTLRTAVQVAEATKEGANCVFEQVLAVAGAGANLKFLTIIPTTLWLVEKAIYENLSQCEDMISGAEATASYQRLGHLHTDLEDLNVNFNAKIDVAQGDLSSMRSALDGIQTKLNVIIELLNTPQGKRRDFPTK